MLPLSLTMIIEDCAADTAKTNWIIAAVEEYSKVLLQQANVSGSLPPRSEDWNNWVDAVDWAIVADELYQCSAKGESITKLGQKYQLVKRQ